MSFDSIEFLIFLPSVFLIYWFVVGKDLKKQNILLLLASYFFYGWWDWRFLALIIFSSTVDYYIGIKLSESNKKATKKKLLLVSIFVNIGFLAFFKYFNFFVDSFNQAFTFLGSPISDPILLNIILPVGISFYTFQTLSYTIDIYRGKLKPTHNIIAFFAFVSFFPQLVAGPIERASNLLPQFIHKRKFNNDEAVDGMRQILWGLFKKIVVANNCAVYANEIFSNHEIHSSSTLLLGATLFAFQIYCDFSGYSDIAIGTSRLFGFNLMRNFSFPYFSRDIAEFWRRWHISLSSWFRDYIYFPLGGSHHGKWISIRNIFIVFILSGFWHGANWTFIVWGALNAIYFLPLMLLNKNRIHVGSVAEGKILPSFKEMLQISITFLLIIIAWVFFRAESLDHALSYLSNMFSFTLLSQSDFSLPSKIIKILVIFIVVEWLQREKQHALDLTNIKYRSIRWIIYYIIVIAIWTLAGTQQEFIYFQF